MRRGVAAPMKLKRKKVPSLSPHASPYAGISSGEAWWVAAAAYSLGMLASSLFWVWMTSGWRESRRRRRATWGSLYTQEEALSGHKRYSKRVLGTITAGDGGLLRFMRGDAETPFTKSLIDVYDIVLAWRARQTNPRNAGETDEGYSSRISEYIENNSNDNLLINLDYFVRAAGRYYAEEMTRGNYEYESNGKINPANNHRKYTLDGSLNAQIPSQLAAFFAKYRSKLSWAIAKDDQPEVKRILGELGINDTAANAYRVTDAEVAALEAHRVAYLRDDD